MSAEDFLPPGCRPHAARRSGSGASRCQHDRHQRPGTVEEGRAPTARGGPCNAAAASFGDLKRLLAEFHDAICECLDARSMKAWSSASPCDTSIGMRVRHAQTLRVDFVTLREPQTKQYCWRCFQNSLQQQATGGSNSFWWQEPFHCLRFVSLNIICCPMLASSTLIIRRKIVFTKNASSGVKNSNTESCHIAAGHWHLGAHSSQSARGLLYLFVSGQQLRMLLLRASQLVAIRPPL